MAARQIRNIVIVGGGTAGWMTAAALAQFLGRAYDIRLIESDDIATIGVGEATVPGIRAFHQALGLDENDFLRHTQGTFKLGIEFVDWAGLGDRYTHGFGIIGWALSNVPFYQYWLKMHQLGLAAELGEYSINTMAARQAKFTPAQTELADSPLANINHAYHFDAGLYARYLRRYAEARGLFLNQ